MDVEVIRKPVDMLKFPNIFGKKINEKILEEIISLEDKFKSATTGAKRLVNPDMRVNSVAYLDDIYPNRLESFFLTETQRLFHDNMEFREIVSTFEYPINEFLSTDIHETQVSRYGNEGEHYDWHIDRFSSHKRILTMVYYFFKEPIEWTGGDIQFTNSPVYDGKEVEQLVEGENLITIKPENNMGVVFSASTAHRVLPTKSPAQFDKGRFSANIWIGKNV